MNSACRMKKLLCVQLLTYSDSKLARDLLRRLLETNMKQLEWCEDVQHPTHGKKELELWLAIRTGLTAWKLALRIRALIGDASVSININGVHYPGKLCLSGGDHEKNCCQRKACFEEGYLCCLKGHTCI